MATRKHKKKQMGGVVFREKRDNSLFMPTISQEKNAFNYFFENSIMTLFSTKTRGGILYKLDLNNGIESPYVLCRSQSPWTPVRSLLLKVCCFSKNGFYNGTEQMNRLNAFSFLNEVRMQKEIYFKSLDETLEPICPSVVHYITPTKEEFNELMGSKEKQQDLNAIFSNIEITGFGLLVMEFLEGFKPLGDFIEKQNPQTQTLTCALAAHELIRMYHITEYLHGDFHLNNFMINPNYPYIVSNPGRVIIIDFGSSYKFNQNKIILNYDNFEKENKTTGVVDILKLNENKIKLNKGFEWIQYFFQNEKMLIELNISRNKMIQFWNVITTNNGPFQIPNDLNVPIFQPTIPLTFKLPPPPLFENANNNISPSAPPLFPEPSAPPLPTTGGKVEIENNNVNIDTIVEPKQKQPDTIKTIADSLMFPPDFVGKIKEIQQYVAMDKLANEPTKIEK